MCRKIDAHMSAFWSVDAAFALVLAVAMFAMFSALLFSASASAMKGADETSGALLSARFSSYALARMEMGGEIDLQGVLAQTGRKYASLRVADGNGDLSFASAGERSGEMFCTARIAMIGGKMARLEACVG